MSSSLGPHIAEWRALRKELDALVVEIGAVRAIVMDEAGKLWCWSSIRSATDSLAPAEEDVEAKELAKLFYEAELKEQTLRLGRHLSILRRDTHEDSYVAESFGEDHYVLVVWCHAMFPALSTQAAIAKSLPSIETLSVALPRLAK